MIEMIKIRMEEREHGRTEGNRRKKKGVKSGEMCPEKD
jgi:hypothetical protein